MDVVSLLKTTSTAHYNNIIIKHFLIIHFIISLSVSEKRGANYEISKIRNAKKKRCGYEL